MPEALQPDGSWVFIGDVRVSTPGLTGRVEVYPPSGPGTRAAENSTDAFEQALARSALTPERTIEFSEHQELDNNGGTRAAGGGSDIELDVPGPGAGFGQLALYNAEDGSITWHFPADIPTGEVPSRGGDRRTYRIPRAVTPAMDGSRPGAQRGLFGAVGKKLVKILSFPLKPVLERAGGYFAEKWERSHRPTLARTFDVAGYSEPTTAELSGADWTGLGGGRALLFVHGTMSRAHTAFGELPTAILGELHSRYEGRVFAFDHYTLSHTPTHNAQLLVDRIPAGAQLEVDIICHSRGGLVSRALIVPGLVDMSRSSIHVRRIIMVAAPNAGTALADTEHLGALMDRATSLLQFLPDNAVLDTLDLILAVVQQLAVGIADGLDGITAMRPDGEYLRELNVPLRDSSTALYAMTSNYNPPKGSPLTRIALNGAADLVFGGSGNDLVVPTTGVYDFANGPRMAAADVLEFADVDAVHHSGYWTHPTVGENLLRWLS